MGKNKFIFAICTLALGACGGIGGSSSGSASANQPTGNEQSSSGGASEFQFVPTEVAGKINWAQFPEFHMNSNGTQKVIFAGPYLSGTGLDPLNHGFSHVGLGNVAPASRAFLPAQNRAWLWTNVSKPTFSSPNWANFIPWGNDPTVYHNYWNGVFAAMANYFPDSAGQAIPNVDMIFSDVETLYHKSQDILTLKYSSLVPPNIQSLSNDDFVDLYRRDMSALFTHAHDYLKSLGYAGGLGAYGEPLIRNRVYLIAQYTWQQWISDLTQRNFLLLDYNGNSNWLNGPTGPYYDACSISAPSAYYFEKYPETKASNPNEWKWAGDYLSYLLFQIEVNRAWTPNPIAIFVWLRFHDSTPYAYQWVSDHMAEATAIFPFFAGANTIYLWESLSNGAGDANLNYKTYEHFINGLYRLSQYNDMFDPGYQLYSPMNARDMGNQDAVVWRGVINHGKMLVAAQNPYQDITDVTYLPIIYQGNTLGTIKLTGLETALVLFDLP